MRILIGVDESPHSKAAVEFVKKMIWPKDTQVTVLSVAPRVVPSYAEIYGGAPLSAQATESGIRTHQVLASTAEQSLQAARLDSKSEVVEGDPRLELIDAARRERADLLVVGSHGRTGLSKLLMGSVASHVVTHAPCSVLVVKLEER